MKSLRPRKALRRVVKVDLPSRHRRGKVPFDISDMMRRLRKVTRPFTPAAMFQLADEGYSSAFEQLVACIISIRTFEETTLPTARQLFAKARTPKAMAELSIAEIDQLIHACTFHRPKARTIHDIAELILAKFDGRLPCDFDTLTSLHGVGPKCANLILGIACDQPHGVPVDIHVHRITNRWGLIAAKTPKDTRGALEQVLPRRHWVEINRLLVPFGKFVCTAKQPYCSTCPLLQYCRQIDVTSHR